MSNTREERLRTYRHTLETLKRKQKYTKDKMEQDRLNQMITELKGLIKMELEDDGGKYII